MSPSAFIPFCEFGGNMSSVGTKIDQFGVPVCNSFQAKILNDQLCYEVDLKKLSNIRNIEKELGLGFNFLMDYNEDRQITFHNSKAGEQINEIGLANSFLDSTTNQDAFIYLNTVGISNNIIMHYNAMGRPVRVESQSH